MFPKHLKFNMSERKTTILPPKAVPSHSIIPMFAITSMINPGSHARCVGIIHNPNLPYSPLPMFNQSPLLENFMCQTFLYSILFLHLHPFLHCRPGKALVLFLGNIIVSSDCSASSVTPFELIIHSKLQWCVSSTNLIICFLWLKYPITNVIQFEVCCLGWQCEQLRNLLAIFIFLPTY